MQVLPVNVPLINVTSNMAPDPMSSYTRWNQETERVKESTKKKKATGAGIHSARSGGKKSAE